MASSIVERVPFEIAIKDPKLLGGRFAQLSVPQQVILKAFYGLKLSDEELIYWSIFQGGATYDELFYPTSVVLQPYEPKEYSRLLPILGRRSGKTDMVVSTAVAYEITLGGHRKYVKPGQVLKVPFLAQTAPDAQKNLNFIRMALEESPILKKELDPDYVASEIRLGINPNYLVVEPSPANKSIGRGHAIPVVILDENAFWYTDKDAANPDFEVVRAVAHAQAQFPFAKQFFPTTPWAEQGIAWQGFNAGTAGRKLRCEQCKARSEKICSHKLDKRKQYSNLLVCHASTAVMQSLEKVFALANPKSTIIDLKSMARKRLEELRDEDPEAFPRESGAQFIKSISGWLNAEKIAKAVEGAPDVRGAELLPSGEAKHHYVATIDPAFRKDSFVLTIGHHDPRVGIVQDYLQYWEPQPGLPLRPGDVLDEIKAAIDPYKVNAVYSDQYQLESLQLLAQDRGFSINGYDFTGSSKAKICGGFRIALYQDRVKLLNNEPQKRQFERLQQKVLQSGSVQIAAPSGEHDDIAMATMLLSRIVMWLMSDIPQKREPEKNIDTDHVALYYEMLERRKTQASLEDDY